MSGIKAFHSHISGNASTRESTATIAMLTRKITTVSKNALIGSISLIAMLFYPSVFVSSKILACDHFSNRWIAACHSAMSILEAATSKSILND
jgi:hypothetical protein